MAQKWPALKQQEVLAAVCNGLSCRQAAARAKVSVATAIRWARAEGISPQAPRRLAPETRAALVAALKSGATLNDAASLFQVSRSTVVRLAPSREASRNTERASLFAALSVGLSRRRAAALLGLSIATAIRWARDFDPACHAPASPSPRKPRPPRFRQDREAKQAELLAAIGSGLSKRRAAAEVGLPVATAIRWASDARGLKT